MKKIDLFRQSKEDIGKVYEWEINERLIIVEMRDFEEEKRD